MVIFPGLNLSSIVPSNQSTINMFPLAAIDNGSSLVCQSDATSFSFLSILATVFPVVLLGFGKYVRSKRDKVAVSAEVAMPLSLNAAVNDSDPNALAEPYANHTLPEHLASLDLWSDIQNVVQVPQAAAEALVDPAFLPEHSASLDLWSDDEEDENPQEEVQVPQAAAEALVDPAFLPEHLASLDLWSDVEEDENPQEELQARLAAEENVQELPVLPLAVIEEEPIIVQNIEDADDEQDNPFISIAALFFGDQEIGSVDPECEHQTVRDGQNLVCPPRPGHNLIVLKCRYGVQYIAAQVQAVVCDVFEGRMLHLCNGLDAMCRLGLLEAGTALPCDLHISYKYEQIVDSSPDSNPSGNLKPQLECQICNDCSDEVVELACGHYLCQACIGHMLTSSVQQQTEGAVNVNSLYCPNRCRHFLTSRRNPAKNYPADQALIQSCLGNHKGYFKRLFSTVLVFYHQHCDESKEQQIGEDSEAAVAGMVSNLYQHGPYLDVTPMEDAIHETLKTHDFYSCGLCGDIYYGGRKDCAAAAAAAADSSKKEYRCIRCVSFGQKACALHPEPEAIAWKCMFCCRPDPATFLCGGVDNYCEDCHKVPGRITNCDPSKCIFGGPDRHPPEAGPPNQKGKRYALGCTYCFEERCLHRTTATATATATSAAAVAEDEQKHQPPASDEAPK